MNELIHNTSFKPTHLTLDLTFRFAQESDLAKLEWQGEYTHFRGVFRKTYQEQCAGCRLMLLADFNNYPIGQVFIALGHTRTPSQGYLYSLRVMQPFQKLGIGTQLIMTAEAIMIERGFRTAAISVAKNNPHARRLYERLHYTVYGEGDGNWSYQDHQGKTIYASEPCWILEKQLVPSKNGDDVLE